MNGINLFVLHSAIQAFANSCAARASSRSLVRALILSLTEGNLVFSNKRRIATSVVPKISLNEVLVLSECLQLL